MTKVLIGILLLLSMTLPTAAQEITAPEVPQSGIERMPEEISTFGKGLWELFQRSISLIDPDLETAIAVNTKIIAVAVICSILTLLTEKNNTAVTISGAASIAAILFQNTDIMIDCAADTVWELCEYGKLLCPVLTTALAAQGGISASAALYIGTTIFLTVLGNLLSSVIVPMVHLQLAFSIANCALKEDALKRFSDMIKKVLIWLLKTLLIIFTSYMSMTGIISGTTDLAALKTTRVVISSVVPVVGSILSDASESVLISMGLIKNAAGIYGIFAVLALFMGTFLKVGVHYLLLKASAAICGLFGDKKIVNLIDDFSSGMGLLVALVATGCLLLLISTVCYLKVMG